MCDRIHCSGRRDGLYKDNLLLRGCTIRNTEEAVGIIIYAGVLLSLQVRTSNNNSQSFNKNKQINTTTKQTLQRLVLFRLYNTILITSALLCFFEHPNCINVSVWECWWF